jgi:Bacterial Ig domain
VQRTVVGRLALLALALATACVAALIGTAAAAVRSAPAQAAAPVRLELTPAAVDIEIGGRPARYTAATLDANGRRTDVTRATTLRFKPIGFQPAGQCDQRKLTAFIQGKLTAFIEANCPGPGRYEVTGELDVPRLSSDPPARLRVVTKRVPPRISSVVRNPSPPSGTVEVKGTTGSCNQEGTLTLEGTDAAPVPVVGEFTAKLKIPAGTTPNSYTLLLKVDCDGELKAGAKLRVEKNQAPKPVDDRVAIDATPGVPSTIKVLGNDSDPDDPDGYETRLTVERDPAHGTAVVRRDQTIDYTPDKGFLDAGKDRFTYRSCDVVGADDQTDCDTATVTVTKLPPEPVADPGITTVQDHRVTIDVMGNDRNAGKPDIPKLRVKPQPVPQGEPRPQSDGTIQYSPKPGFIGKDTFQYDYCGGPTVVTANERCPAATVTVTVEPLPVDPRINSVDPNPSPPNREVMVKGTTGTCDKAATLTLDSAPKPALPVPVTGGQDGSFEAKLKVPPGTFVGSYRLQLQVVCDGQARAIERELKVANQPPTAADDLALTIMDTPITIDVAANDVDPDGDDGYRTSLDPGTPDHGTAEEQQPGNRIRYRPEAGFTGEDRFRYRFCDLVDADDTPDCGAATVTVTVDKPPPKAAADTARTVRDRPVRIEVTGNDKHPDPAKLHVSRPPAPPATAVEQRQPPGSILYTPARGFTGTDAFQYDYCGGSVVVDAAGRAACTPATVTVTVARPDPVPVDDPDATTVRDQPVVIDVMGNDRDPDPSRLRLRPQPRASGRPERLPDGRVRYTPSQGFTGTDTFRYDYCGGPVDADAAGRACPFATVTVTVTATPTISSVRPGSSPAGRKVEVTGNTGSCKRAGTLNLQETSAAVDVNSDRDGSFTASLTIPPGTFPGEYRLELRVDCNGQAQRAEATLTVTNRAPEAVDDADTTTRDHPVTIPVTRNDRDPDDPDGHQNLVLVTSPPAHGTAEVQPDQTILYTPASGFVGQDQFGYSLCDNVLNAAGGADCGNATVTVTVTDTPVISSVTPGSTPPGQPVQVVGNTGSCSRSGTLIFHGPVDLPLSVSADENGRFATGFTVPAGTFPQPYQLELRVDCGGQVQRAEATLTVTNQEPVAVDDPAATTPDTPVTIDVTANDDDPDDPDGHQNLVLVTSPPAHGTAEVQPDQTILYTPASGFVGQDQFGYSLCDNVLNAAGAADCGNATVTVTVSGTACVPASGTPRLEIAPGKGPGGTRLRITAAVDRRLAACPLRFFLGRTPLGPDVRVAGDGSISADREVPGNAKRGRSTLRLATQNAQTLVERPFDVVGGPIPWPVRLALGAGALLVGALARIAFRRWRASREQRSGRRPAELPDDVWAEPHTRPVEVGVEPVPDGTQTFAVRLQPHADPGTQTLQEG